VLHDLELLAGQPFLFGHLLVREAGQPQHTWKVVDALVCTEGCYKALLRALEAVYRHAIHKPIGVEVARARLHQDIWVVLPDRLYISAIGIDK
jgi:hypothetical protein